MEKIPKDREGGKEGGEASTRGKSRCARRFKAKGLGEPNKKKKKNHNIQKKGGGVRGNIGAQPRDPTRKQEEKRMTIPTERGDELNQEPALDLQNLGLFRPIISDPGL